jgi:hypothetical protein
MRGFVVSVKAVIARPMRVLLVRFWLIVNCRNRAISSRQQLRCAKDRKTKKPPVGMIKFVATAIVCSSGLRQDESPIEIPDSDIASDMEIVAHAVDSWSIAVIGTR